MMERPGDDVTGGKESGGRKTENGGKEAGNRRQETILRQLADSK
ncbi:MAG: hypothetical protein ACP5EQ_02980 [Candidatus Cloacimonadia bacterium]